MTLVVVVVATVVAPTVVVVVALPSSVITSRAVIKLVLPAPHSSHSPISSRTPGNVVVVVAHVCGLWRQFCGFNAHCKHFTVVYGCQLMLGCYGR